MTKVFINNDKSIFEYAYIDGSNYKSFGQLKLSGDVSSYQKNFLGTKLENGRFFVAEQLDIPPLYDGLFKYSNGPTLDDHGWHVFVDLRNVSCDETLIDAPVWGSVEEFLAKFRKVEEWDPALSTNFTVCRAVNA